MHSKRGLAGWILIFASLIVWLIIIIVWYRPSSVLDLTDKTNLFIVIWWSIVCIICLFIGYRIERRRETQ
ncbi:hypothetical protein J4461_02125 [Candidatus Pacearchaeota archaeon]|nr:hypothetical protein [Candidatus Pacearchaeota archaeon]